MTQKSPQCLLPVRLLILMGYFSALQLSGASCPRRQSQACLSAAKSGDMSGLSSAGACQEKTYSSEFTHLCQVLDYNPRQQFKHCCCVIDETAMCCNYQQNWNLFRCAVSTDSVGQLSSNSSSNSVSLYIILPVAVGGLLVLVIIVYCLKRFCATLDGKTESCKTTLCKKDVVEDPPVEDDESADQLADLPQQPIRRSSRPQLMTERKCLDNNSSQPLLQPPCTANNDDDATEPTAPSMEELGLVLPAEPHDCEVFTRSQSQGYLRPEQTVLPHYTRSSSVPVNGHPIPSVCPSCSSMPAPPTYTESQEHQVLPV